MRFPEADKYRRAVIAAKAKGVVEDDKSLEWWTAVCEAYEILGGKVWGKEEMLKELTPKVVKKEEKKPIKKKK